MQCLTTIHLLDELIERGLGVADGSVDYEEIVSWINEHLSDT